MLGGIPFLVRPGDQDFRRANYGDLMKFVSIALFGLASLLLLGQATAS